MGCLLCDPDDLPPWRATEASETVKLSGDDKMLNYEVRERLERFSELLAVTHENVIVRHIANLYANGDIVTFEEALHQIIVRLTADFSQQQAELYRVLQMQPPRHIRVADEGTGL